MRGTATLQGARATVVLVWQLLCTIDTRLVMGGEWGAWGNIS